MAEYLSKTIGDVVLEMVNRTTFLPAIQREYVWSTSQIEKLFDSLMCDYPINTMLFWHIREEDKKKWTSYEFLRDYDYSHPHNNYANLDGVNNDIYLVLDGQQRITSLNIALRGSYKYFYYREHKTYLYLNILHEPINDNPEELTYQFAFRENDAPSRNLKEPELWYRVGDILNYGDAEDAKETAEKTILSHIEDDNIRRKALKMIGKLHGCIMTKKVINYYEEKSSDYDKVMEIFVRTNTGGQRLEYSDILLSTATAKWKTLNAREEINTFTDEINAIGNGYSFGKDFVMKGAMYLTKDLPIQYKLSSFTRENLELIESHWNETKDALRDAVTLVHKFGFNDKNLVSKFALLPIAQYLKNKKSSKYLASSDKADVEDQNNIQVWLIKMLLRNVMSSNSDFKLQQMRKVIGDNGQKFPTSEILQIVNADNVVSIDEINVWLGYKYGSRYSYLILSLLYPARDWKDRHFQEDHIFPYSKIQRKELRAIGYDDDKINQYISMRDTICNLELLDDIENNEKRAKDFADWVISRDANFHSRHYIPQLSSYSIDDFEAFISARKQLLTDTLLRLLSI